MAKAQRLGGWMTRFKRCIDAEAGAAVSKKVIIETERFDATSNYAQKAELIKNAVRRLEKETGKPTARKVMQACGMKCCGPTQQKRDNHCSAPDRNSKMREYEIVDTNADNIDGCSLCGNKNANNLGRRRKANWLKERYAEGLRYKVLHSEKFGDIGMIEYAPGSHAWRPVEAEGYLVIHCLWVIRKHKGKGLGTLLLDSCLRDAKQSNCRGVAVVTSSSSFMAGSDLFIKAGFVSVDRISPYELLVKKFKKAAPDPRFIVDRERLLKRYKNGLTILGADQCTYVIKSVERIAEASRALGLKPKVVRVRSAKESRELPTPYGIFSIVYDGKLIAERPISATRFISIMRRNAE